MILRFKTSVGGQRCSFIEGQTIEVARPTPEMIEWLNRGLVEAVRDGYVETAVSHHAVERAVGPQRRGRGGRGRRGATSVA